MSKPQSYMTYMGQRVEFVKELSTTRWKVRSIMTNQEIEVDLTELYTVPCPHCKSFHGTTWDCMNQTNRQGY